MKLKTLTAIGSLGVVLVACGGGSSGDTVPAPTTGDGVPTLSGIPASALQSVDAFVAYLRLLAADETAEPLLLPDAALPTSGTAEPT